MGKLSIFIFVLFLAGLAVFAIHNKEVTTITIPFSDVYEIPKIALILLSCAAGALAMLLVFAIRDTKKFIDNWQFQKRRKQETKVQELYSKALIALLAHKEAEAKEALGHILAEEPDHLHALLKAGEIAVREEDYQTANSYFNKARMIDHHSVEVLFAIEGVMEKTSRWSDALRYLDEILDIDDANLTALYKKREVLETLGSWDDIVYLQKSILKYAQTEKEKKKEHLALVGYEYEYGRHSLEQNQLEKAKKAFKSALRLEKDFIPATLGIAEVMLREGESEEAVKILENAYDETCSKIILARLEDLLIGLGEPSRLIGIYKNSILKNPSDPVLKFFLGKLFYRLEMIDDALETLQGIDTGGAAYPDMHQLLGNLYLRRNILNRAVSEFKKAVDIKMSLRLPYCCVNCGYASSEWSGRCPDCREWNTFRFNIDGACKL